jgi:hypothetical protein
MIYAMIRLSFLPPETVNYFATGTELVPGKADWKMNHPAR